MHNPVTKSMKNSGEIKYDAQGRAPELLPVDNESGGFPIIRAAVREMRKVAGLRETETPQTEMQKLEVPRPVTPRVEPPKVEAPKLGQPRGPEPEGRSLTPWEDISQSLHVARHVQLIALLVAGTDRNAAEAALRDRGVLKHIPELQAFQSSSEDDIGANLVAGKKIRGEISGMLDRLEKEVDATREKSKAGLRTLSLIRDVRKIVQENESPASSVKGVLPFEPQVAKDILERLNTHLKAQPEGYRSREDGLIPLDSEQAMTLKRAGWLAEGMSVEDANDRGHHIAAALKRALGIPE